MLQRLSISNYAIIDSLDIDLANNLNIITGETGAGKSIIVGALGLILGERADSSVLNNSDREKKCIVEGIFQMANTRRVKKFLEQHDLDADDELVVRREIGSNGKSRAFINDTPVNLGQLQMLSSLLVDMHQQFDTLEIGDSDFQREVIDALAGNEKKVSAYQQLYRQWTSLSQECDELKTRKQQFEREADYNRFQYTELEEAGFRENEIEDADAELKLMSHSENIKSALNRVSYELEENEDPLVPKIKSLISLLQGVQDFHADLAAVTERLQSVQIELKDIAGEISRISDHIIYDPEKIELFNERLSLGYKLLKKHGVQTTAELLAIQKQLSEKLQAVLNIDEQIRQKEDQANSLKTQAVGIAHELHAARIKQVRPFEEKVNALLAQVGMPNARLKVEIVLVENPDPYGLDRIEFLFNANLPKSKGTDKNNTALFQPVRKVASGGELSRLMLCIKSLVAQSMDMPTLIFDEIDTGISGEAARQVGNILKGLAKSRQVICITHQPQIAGKADTHFLVYKENVKDQVKTNIRRLSNEERITTIARMLSGEKPTAAALENAKEMVGSD